MPRLPGLILCGLLAACGSDDDPPPGPDASDPVAVEALFELPRAGATADDFYALPFPNDLRRDADGGVDLSAHPRLGTAVDAYIDAADEADGFSPGAPAFFRFSEALDPASLPESPVASLAEDASVYLVVVDTDSPLHGMRHAVRFRFEPEARATIGAHWLSVLPVHGLPLQPDTTYAAVVTRRVRGDGDLAVEPAPDMTAVLAATGGDAAVTHAREVYAPLLAWLDEAGGDEREDVVAAALFTTRDPTRIMRLARVVVHRDVPAPVARDFVEKTDDATPGYGLFTGEYDGPQFQAGTPPFSSAAQNGRIEVDSTTGEPVLQGMQEINFALAIPDGTPPAEGWPLVIYGHGTGGDHLSFHRDGTAERLTSRGLAVLGFEGVLQGLRHPSGGDSLGLGFFNFVNPFAWAATWQQGGIDYYQVVRLAKTLEGIDDTRISVFGHSQGTEVGSLALPFEPDVDGAVLSGGAAYVTLILLNKTKPVVISFPALMKTYAKDDDVDEFSNVMALVQLAFDPGDPAFYMPLIAAHPVAGVAPKHVLLTQGIGDEWGPAPGVESMAVALEAPPLAPVLSLPVAAPLLGLVALTPPVSVNLGSVTVAFAQYEPAPGEDGHFVVFDVDAARAQTAGFLESLAESGVATIPVAQ